MADNDSRRRFLKIAPKAAGVALVTAATGVTASQTSKSVVNAGRLALESETLPEGSGAIHVQGHRGASGHYPENTLEAFKAALEAGAGIELYVHLSSDGIPVVIHDRILEEHVKNTAFIDEKRPHVGDYTAGELTRLDVGGDGEAIPTLEDVLELVSRYEHAPAVNIEPKGRGTAGPVVDVVNRFLDNGSLHSEQLQFSSFDMGMLREVKEMAPDIDRGILFAPSFSLAGNGLTGEKDELLSVHKDGEPPYNQLATEENVARLIAQIEPATLNPHIYDFGKELTGMVMAHNNAHPDKSLGIATWHLWEGVPQLHPNQMMKIIDTASRLGIDTTLITNYPEEALELFPKAVEQHATGQSWMPELYSRKPSLEL